MKFAVAFTLIAGVFASNPFVGRSKNNAKASYTASLLKKSRRLNQNQNNQVDISSYAVKFEKCQFIKAYSDELAEDQQSDTVLAMKRFVIFRLCPDTACSTCDSNYGEYMIDLDDYLQATVEYEKRNQEEMCNACQECAAEADNADADAAAAGGNRKLAVDCSTCATECEKIADMEANGYVDATEFLECKLIYGPDDDAKEQLYAGPICASSGSKISIGVFTDQYCYVADESKSVDDYLVSEEGNAMKLSHALLKLVYSGSCISCAKEEEDNNDNQANDMCKQLYETAAKCEASHGFDSGYEEYGGYENQVAQESAVCDFIASVSKGSYDTSGEISIKGANIRSGSSASTTGGQKFALTFFILGTVGLAAYAAMLHNKLIKGGKAGLSNQGGAMA